MMYNSRSVSKINIKCIWPAIIAGAAQLGSTILGNVMGRANAKDAGDMSKNVYMRRYQYTTADMKAAGLNPILAATGGFNVGSGVQYPAAPPPQMPDYASLYGADVKGQHVAQEIENMQQDIKNKRQQVNESMARTARERAQAGLVTQQEKNALREWSLIDQRITNAIAEYEKLSSQAALTWRQKEEVNKTIKSIELDIKKQEFLLNQIGRVSAAYKGPIGAALGYIKAIADALGLHTSAGAGATSSAVRMVK